MPMHTIFNITPLEAFLNDNYLDGKFGSMALSGVDMASQIVAMYRKGLNSGDTQEYQRCVLKQLSCIISTEVRWANATGSLRETLSELARHPFLTFSHLYSIS
jgi:hypothetical protein